MSDDRRDQLSPIKRALLEVREMRERMDALERARTEPIAIVGMGVRLPGGVASCDEFWSLLDEGRDAIGRVPEDRWDAAKFHDPSPDAAGKIVTREGGFVNGVDRFDANFFGISPREAASMDPQQRMLLEVAWEALEHAGQPPDTLGDQPTGVYVGLGSTDYLNTEIKFGRQADIDPYLATGGVASVAAGRLSYVLGLKGPSLTVDTACSSSLVAVHLAVQSLRLGECRVALAAGVNLLLLPELSINCSRARMLAPDGRCKTFDTRADGYVRSEGCAVVVLKRLSDALADGDRVATVIRGSAVNQDGRSSGLTVPNGPAQETVINEALRHAGASADEIDYIEAHGTGTALGDPIELRALGRVFASRPRAHRVPVGSVKTNLGHLEAAAGLAGLIKVVLALQHDRLPRHLHLQEPTRHVDWSQLPLYVPTQHVPWPRIPEKPRLAGISSFGFSGTNAHVIVGDVPACEPLPAGVARPVHLLTVSAKSPEALQESARRLSVHLARRDESLSDICYTANAGRMHHPERAAVVASSADEVRVGLLALAEGRTAPSLVARSPASVQASPIAFLFSGLGGQHTAMGRILFDTEPEFRNAILRCEQILTPHLDRPLTSLLYPASAVREPIDDVAHSQPLLFAFEYALASLWQSWGVQPTFVLGHSLGEDVAACVAGVFSLEDGLTMVAGRARLMADRLGHGAMAAVFAPEAKVRALVPEGHEISFAAFNGPNHVVLAGSSSAIHDALVRCTAAKFKVRRLTVGRACHSPLMDPVLDDVQRLATAMTCHAPRLGVASTLSGRLAAGDELSSSMYWRNHVRMPVRFAEAVQALYDAGVRVMLGIGPDGVISRMGSRAVGAHDVTWLTSFDGDATDESRMLSSLASVYAAGARIDWKAFHRQSGSRKVVIPTYPFQRERHWSDAVRPRVPDDEPRQTQEWHSDALYEIEWRACPLNAAAEREDPVRSSWIVLVDRGGTGGALVTALRERGEDCIEVRVGAETTIDSAEAWSLDPRDPQAFTRLMAAAPANVRAVIDCWSLDVCSLTDSTTASLDDAAVLGCGAALHTLRALVDAGMSARLWVLTRQAVKTRGGDSLQGAAQASVWGLGRVASLEVPESWGGLIDLDDRPARDLAGEVLREIEARDGDDQVALRPDGRWVPRIVRAQQVQLRTLPLRSDSTYLIAGGLGSIGLHLAREMARQGAGHLVLVARSGLPSRDQWDGVVPESRVGIQIAMIREMERLGATVTPWRAELSSEADSEELRSFLATLPPLRGVVQAMAQAGHARVTALTLDDVLDVLRPKVHGTWQLDRLAESAPLDFFVLFSSMAGIIGASELAHYAAANAFVDAFAAARRAAGRPTVSISWGLWSVFRESESLHHAIDRSGMKAMPLDRALEAFTNLRQSRCDHVVFADVDWQTLKPLLESRRARPFLDELLDRNQPAVAGTESALLVSLRQARTADRKALLQAHIRRETAEVLSLPVSQLDPRRGLYDMGMDSLMSLALKSRLESAILRTLPATLTFNYPSVAALTEYIAGELFGDIESSSQILPDEAVVAAAAVPADDDLSEDELASMLASRLEQLRS
jgi:acyl transferase domain-containing protein